MNLKKYTNNKLNWKLYKAVHGNSGVTQYTINDDYVGVRFKGEDRYSYFYDIDRIEREHVEAMKNFALKGERLSSYISRHEEVRDFAIKVPNELLK